MIVGAGRQLMAGPLASLFLAAQPCASAVAHGPAREQ
jgi:hypothetical protein